MTLADFPAIGDKEIIMKAIRHYGKSQQMLMAIEEMSELTKALCKDFRNTKGARGQIVEEMADVYIMLAQLEIIFEAQNDLYEIVDRKLERLEKRMETDK